MAFTATVAPCSAPTLLRLLNTVTPARSTQGDRPHSWHLIIPQWVEEHAPVLDATNAGRILVCCAPTLLRLLNMVSPARSTQGD